MEYKDLIDYGKSIFNFHPHEEFESIEDLLFAARKNVPKYEFYDRGAAIMAEELARFIDSKENSITGMEIKTGDMLHIGINSDGKYAVRLADSDNPANAYAAEDITGPDISWNQKTGEVFNFPVTHEVSIKQR